MGRISATLSLAKVASTRLRINGRELGDQQDSRFHILVGYWDEIAEDLQKILPHFCGLLRSSF
jgi:hypothetical protein